jgi:hypothetical protein
MSDVSLGKDQEYPFKIDFRDVSLQIYNEMLLKFLIILPEIVVNPTRLFFLDETLIYHILAPRGVGGIHGD